MSFLEIKTVDKFSSCAFEVHPKFAYLEAYKYYLLSALSNETSKFFLILYRSYKRIRIDEKVCIRT